MAHVQPDIEQCLAAIRSHTRAIMLHGKAVAKLKTEVERLRAVGEGVATNGAAESGVADDTTLSVLKLSAAVAQDSLLKKLEDDSSMVVPAIVSPCSPLSPAADCHEADTAPRTSTLAASEITDTQLGSKAGCGCAKLATATSASLEQIRRDTKAGAEERSLHPDPAVCDAKDDALKSKSPVADDLQAIKPLPAAQVTLPPASLPSARFLPTRPRNQLPLKMYAKPRRTSGSLALRVRPKSLGLLSLPRELRDRIYELAVAPGRVLIPSTKSVSHNSDTPRDRAALNTTVAYDLFRVNKQVNQEAMEMYFKKNVIRFHAGEATSRAIFVGERCQPMKNYSFAAHRACHLTSVELICDVRDFSIQKVLGRTGRFKGDS